MKLNIQKQYWNAVAINLLVFALLCLTLNACSMKPDAETLEKWKQEIRDTEQKFAQLVAEKGLHAGFVAYAAEDAVLMRNNAVVVGKAGIDQLYQGQDMTGLAWSPDFVDVAASGDLGYTYGKYTFTAQDSSGNPQVSTGIFHTVWKRQANGEWKFVWD